MNQTFVLLIFAAFSGVAVFAQEAAESADEPELGAQLASGWEFSIAPYLWMSSISADVTADGATTHMHVPFSDILSDLDMGSQLRLEGYRGRWGFYLDGTYLKLSDDTSVRLRNARLFSVDVDAELTQGWLDFGVMYRAGKPGKYLELFAGGRYVYMGIDVSAGPLDIDESTDSLAPVIGARIQRELSPKWVASFKADVGGFGVGEAAELSWGATAVLGYRINPRTTLALGYRYYDVDIESGEVEIDLQMYGPIVGLQYKF